MCVWYESCGMKLFVFVTDEFLSFYFSHSTSALARVFCLATPRLETGIPSPTLPPPAHSFFCRSPPRFLGFYCRPNTGAGPNNVPNACSAVISPLVTTHCISLQYAGNVPNWDITTAFPLNVTHILDTSTQSFYPCQHPMAVKPLACNMQFNLFAIYHSSQTKTWMYDIVGQTKEHRKFTN